jgi:hypothetical protein
MSPALNPSEKKQIQVIKAATKKALSSKQASKDFLKAAGIIRK